MNNLSNSGSELFDSEKERSNLLWQYVQSLHPEIVAQLSKPPLEVVQVMERNLVSMLGHLPHEHFGVTITTSREQLGRLLSSAMMSGYFLHNAEQRMVFEKSWQGAAEATEKED
jgi:hypothetical protein